MGQLIPFPARPTAFPDEAAGLETAECVLLLAIRWWVEDYRAGADPIPRLCEALDNADAPDAAFSIDGLMTTLARLARRPVDIHCPRCPALSADEKQLLHAAGLAQAGNGAVAEKALRTALLSADGAAFALAALEGLGGLFAQAHLFLRRRQSPTQDAADEREAWSPPQTLH
jgi:hypothetical protein